VILGEFQPAVMHQFAQSAAKIGILRRRHTQFASERSRLQRMIIPPGDGGENLLGETRHFDP